jgi:hypothetical protein
MSEPKIVRNTFESGNSTEKKLNLSELKIILTVSFMLSQGDPIYQSSLLLEIRNYYGPQPEISDDQKKQLDMHIFNVLGKLRKHKFHENVESIYEENYDKSKYETMNDVEDLPSDHLEILEDIFTPEVGGDTLDLLKSFVSIDLTRMKARQNRNPENDGNNSLGDRYMSFFVNHVMRGHKTGDAGFDNLMKRFRETLPEYCLSSGEINKNNFDELIEFYNSKHPKTIVTEEEIDKIIHL